MRPVFRSRGFGGSGAGRGVAGAALLALWALSQSFGASAQTSVSGPINASTTWSTANSPYVVTGNVDVLSNATLTIQPGVTVYVQAGRAISVQNGALSALGTAANPIVFTSDVVRTGGAGAPGQWGKLTFNAGASASKLENVVVEFGQGVSVNGSAPTFNFANIRNNAGPAIAIDLAASPAGVGNRASGNTLNAITVPAGDITGNVTWGLRGIPYVVSSGRVSVGTSPAIVSVTPNAIEQGETVTVTLTGDRLQNASSASFESSGLTTQILAGGTASQVQLSVTAAPDAALGGSALRLLVDAGEARRASALTVTGPQFRLNSIAPATVFVNQGPVQLQLTGSQFTSDAIAYVNGAAVPTVFVSSTRLTATLANQSGPGALAVRVRMPDPVNAGQFVYSTELALPVVAPALALDSAQATLVNGQVRNFTLTLPYAAPAGGQLINLVSSIPGVASVPANVTVPEGGLTANIPVSALGVGSTTVTASRNGFASAQVLVTVVPPPSLTIAPNTLAVGVGRTAQLTVTSSAAAPGGGAVINLSSSSPAFATVPATVTIPAGQTTVAVTLSTVAVGNTTITAQANGYVSGTSQVSVRPVSINFAGSSVVAPGLSRTVPASLSDPAPTGGLTIALSSSNPSVLTVPASVTVPAGETLLSIPVTGVALGSATVTASAPGYQDGTLSMSVEAINITFSGPSTSIPVAATHVYTVNLSRPAPAGGITISLATVNPALASVSPATIDIPAGQTSGGTVRASVTGVATGSTQISASAPGLPNGTLNVNITPQAQLVFSDTSLTVGRGMTTYQNEVYVYLRSGGNSYSAPAGATVTLTSSDPTRFTAPATVNIPAGSYYTYFQFDGIANTGATPQTLTASAPAFTTSTPATVNVVDPVVTLTGFDNPRSVNAVRDQVIVRLTVPGADYSQNQTLQANTTVDLSLVEVTPPGIVPDLTDSNGQPISQLTLTAGNNSDGFYIESPTGAGTYRVQASVPALGLVATSGVVTVQAPELRFSDTSIIVGRGMQTYQNEVYLWRAVNGNSSTSPTATVVTLTSSDPSKVTVPATVTIPANSYYTYFYITGVDNTTSPVTISASAAGHTASVTPISANVITPLIQVNSTDTNRSTASARDDFTVRPYVTGADYPSNQTLVAPLSIDLSIAQASTPGIVDGIYASSTGGSPITQATIAAGSSVSPTLFVGTPTVGGTYRVQASVPSWSTSGLSAVTNVVPPELRFSESAITVGRGMRTYVNEVYLYRAINGNTLSAPTALTVNLTSSDPTRVSVPATVTIPANNYYAYFYVTGVDLTSGTPVNITATADGYNPSVTPLKANVVTPVFNFQSVDTSRSPASARDNFSVTTNVPGAGYANNQTWVAPVTLDLAITEANPPGIVSGFFSAASGGSAVTQATIQAGNTQSDTVYAETPVSAGTYRMTATHAATSSVATSPQVTVIPPELRFSDAGIVVGNGLRTYVNEVYLYRAVNGNTLSVSTPLTVNLTCNSTVICNVPATVTIPANTYYAYFTVTGTGIGTTTVTASAPGYNSVQDLNVSVIVPELRFTSLPGGMTVGTNSTVRVGMRTPGAAYAFNQTAVAPVVVNITSSSPDVATVPATLTIAAGANDSGNGQISAVAPGTTTITSSSSGFNPASSNVTVTP